MNMPPFQDYGAMRLQQHQNAMQQLNQGQSQEKPYDFDPEQMDTIMNAVKAWQGQRHTNEAPPMHPEDDLYVPPGAAAGGLAGAPPVAPVMPQPVAQPAPQPVVMPPAQAPAPAPAQPSGFLQAALMGQRR